MSSLGSGISFPRMPVQVAKLLNCFIHPTNMNQGFTLCPALIKKNKQKKKQHSAMSKSHCFCFLTSLHSQGKRWMICRTEWMVSKSLRAMKGIDWEEEASLGSVLSLPLGKRGQERLLWRGTIWAEIWMLSRSHDLFDPVVWVSPFEISFSSVLRGLPRWR